MKADAPGPVTGGSFHLTIAVRWGDLDAQNHVNNTVYFRYFEEARIQLFRQAGLALGENKVGLLAHASCDFLHPIMYPATVVVTLTLERVGRTSMELAVSLHCQEDPGRVYARGKNVIVGADMATGRPQPWSETELAALAPCFV